MTFRDLLYSLKGNFSISGDLEDQPQIEASIRSGVSFRGTQLLTLIFAIFVASLGLNTDSTPVVIGAMLISPLMGPIIGMGLGIGIHDFPLLRKGLKNIGLAVLGSIIASGIYFLISPQYEGNTQLLARTSPSIYDAFIALFGGAAGILSIAAKNKGQVLPGVAIATSLMPPLCTAGYGLATMQWHFFLGALYLFFTNMVFILFATWIGVKLMGLRPITMQDSARARRVQALVWCIVLATVGISVYLTSLMIGKSIFLNKADNFVTTELQFPGTEIMSHKEYLSTGHAASTPGEDVTRMYTLMQTQIQSEVAKNDSLTALLKNREKLEDAALRLAPEIKVVFPGITDLAVSHSVVASVDYAATPDTVTVLMVRAPYGLTASEHKKLAEYAEVRLGVPSIQVSVNPSFFPWPAREEPKQTKQ